MPAAVGGEEEDDAPLSEAEAAAAAARRRRIRDGDDGGDFAPAADANGTAAPALAVTLAFMVGVEHARGSRRGELKTGKGSARVN